MTAPVLESMNSVRVVTGQLDNFYHACITFNRLPKGPACHRSKVLKFASPAYVIWPIIKNKQDETSSLKGFLYG